MQESKGTESLDTFLANQQLSNVRDVDISMMNLRPLLRTSGRDVAEEFHVTYHAVTSNISDMLDARKTLDIHHFKQPDVLNTATSEFYPLYTENLVKPKKHWEWLDDERSRLVDGATRGTLGYISHIGGDLSLTVNRLANNERFEPQQVKDYLRHDYSLKIDKVLWRTAHQIAPALTDIENVKARRGLTNTFMVGVILGRQIALADARRMTAAKSEDEVQFILDRSRQQTAKVADKVLSLSLEINNWIEQSSPDKSKTPTQIEPWRERKQNASRKLAGLIGYSLRRAA